MKNFKKICSVENLVGCRRGGFQTLPYARLGWLALLFLLTNFIYLAPSAFSIPAERDNFIILGRSGQDSEGKNVLMEEKIVLRTAPNVNSPEQGRLDSGTSVRVLDIIQIETETFYLVMKVGEGGGLSGWVNEEYIYEVLSEPQQE